MPNPVTDRPYRPLAAAEIQTLTAQGCTAADWSRVQVADGFDPAAVRNAQFLGDVRIGANGGTVAGDGAIQKPCGIYQALVSNCTIGDRARIANVGLHIANYDIGDGACIENAGRIETRPGATFGNGVEVEVLNEAGGREVVLFDRLDSQFAHLVCLHRYRGELVDKLIAVAKAEAARAAAERGRIGAGCPDRQRRQHRRREHRRLCRDRRSGGGSPEARSSAASEAPAQIGSGVEAADFIIAEGSKVTGGAILAKSFVGQGCQIGKQFSSEGSLFFANCEAFHGEACSIFAAPTR